ncbi:MAG: PTS sugar transporter subunit IIB [Endomicrobia bacterium]|nr:PTS sugar transporter subunit IIB [Endomicrobiia bacterium]
MSYIIRVDDRLIHGQVVEGWIKPLNIDTIVICSDLVACDIIERTLFEMSTPKHVKLECNTIVSTAEKIINNSYEKINTLILISSLEDLYNLVIEARKISSNYIFPPVNIGGIRYCEGRKQLYKALCLNKQDLQVIKELNDLGIVLEYYLLPLDTKIVLNNIINEIETNLK